MESPLEVLSRAATMVQDNANESRLTTKELPTTKWRRDRRLRTSEYHHNLSSASSSPPSPQTPHSSTVRPLSETTNTTTNPIECPIDMSVSSTTIKPRSPPPPYREPLPGSTFATVLPRPSVITQAPKRDNHCTISNRENDNHSTESISMCDPVIDEHFRRSLGANYMALFDKKSPPLPQPPSAPQTKLRNNTRTTVTLTNNDAISTSVDDHFAKALGDTWKKLQADKETKTDELDK